MSFVIRAGQVLLAVAFGWLAGSWWTWPTAALVIAVLAGLAVACGNWLLLQTGIGELSWRNRCAGWLMPWGYVVGRGKLLPLAATSAVVWAGLGWSGLVAAATSEPAAAHAGWRLPSLLTFATMTSWIVGGGALLYLVGQLARSPNWRRRPGSTLAKCCAIVCLLLLASLALRLAGYPRLACLISGGPPAVLGSLFGLWTLVLLIAERQARWN